MGLAAVCIWLNYTSVQTIKGNRGRPLHRASPKWWCHLPRRKACAWSLRHQKQAVGWFLGPAGWRGLADMGACRPRVTSPRAHCAAPWLRGICSVSVQAPCPTAACQLERLLWRGRLTFIGGAPFGGAGMQRLSNWGLLGDSVCLQAGSRASISPPARPCLSAHSITIALVGGRGGGRGVPRALDAAAAPHAAPAMGACVRGCCPSI